METPGTLPGTSAERFIQQQICQTGSLNWISCNIETVICSIIPHETFEKNIFAASQIAPSTNMVSWGE